MKDKIDNNGEKRVLTMLLSGFSQRACLAPSTANTRKTQTQQQSCWMLEYEKMWLTNVSSDSLKVIEKCILECFAWLPLRAKCDWKYRQAQSSFLTPVPCPSHTHSIHPDPTLSLFHTHTHAHTAIHFSLQDVPQASLHPHPHAPSTLRKELEAERISVGWVYRARFGSL